MARYSLQSWRCRECLGTRLAITNILDQPPSWNGQLGTILCVPVDLDRVHAALLDVLLGGRLDDHVGTGAGILLWQHYPVRRSSVEMREKLAWDGLTLVNGITDAGHSQRDALNTLTSPAVDGVVKHPRLCVEQLLEMSQLSAAVDD